MPHIRITYFDGLEWKLRGEGEADVTADEAAATLPAYSIQYPHKLFFDGVLIAETIKPSLRHKTKLIRH